MLFELNKNLIIEISHAAENQQGDYIKKKLFGVHAADISALLVEIEIEEARYIFSVLDSDIRAGVLSNLEEEIQKDFLKFFTSQEIAPVIDFIDSDDAVDILHKQSVKKREEILALMHNKEKIRYIIDLLPYEDDCAGGLMAKEFISVNVNWNVKECIKKIRKQGQKIEKVFAVYVVNNEDVLLGRVSLKRIIISQDHILIKDIFHADIQTAQTYYTAEEVANIMKKYDLEVIPVVNIQGKILGRITIDDIVDVITEQAEREQQMMAGIAENIEDKDSVWMISRARLPWLIIGVVGGLLGAHFISFFEKEIRIIPAMAFFIPLITATGGNVGIQSSTIVVQTLSSISIMEENIFSRLLKTCIVAIINGLLIALLVFSFNIFFSTFSLAFIVSIALFCVVMLASFTGTFTPILLNKLGINPALASGPFITTANDLLGLFVYFIVAKSLLG